MKFLVLPLLALVTSTQAADLAGDFKGPIGLSKPSFLSIKLGYWANGFRN